MLIGTVGLAYPSSIPHDSKAGLPTQRFSIFPVRHQKFEDRLPVNYKLLIPHIVKPMETVRPGVHSIPRDVMAVCVAKLPRPTAAGSILDNTRVSEKSIPGSFRYWFLGLSWTQTFSKQAIYTHRTSSLELMSS